MDLWTPIEIMILGAVALGAIAWQVYLIWQCDELNPVLPDWDDVPSRAMIPMVFGLIAVLGCVLYAAFSLLTNSHSPIQQPGDAIAFVFRSVVFWIVVTAKGYFGPLVVGFVISFAIYNLFEFQELRAIPIFRAIGDWVFASSSSALHWTYVGIIFTYSFGTSLRESLDF